jgi:hypothetical protein
MRTSVQSSVQSLAIVATILVLAGSAFGKAEGIDSRATFEPLGCGSADGGAAGDCHVQPLDPALTVTIAGPTQIDPGPQGSGLYTVSIPTDFGGLKGAGMNVAIGAPNTTGCKLEEFAPIDKMGTRNEVGAGQDDFVLSHDYNGDPPPTTLENVWSYQFLLVNCQTPGPLLLLAAMNAFDGDGTELGEIWNKTQLDVTVPEPGAALLGATSITALAMRRRTRP